MLCQFLLYNIVKQLYIFISSFPLESSTTTSIPPLGMGSGPCGLQQVSIIYFIYGGIYICQCYSPNSSHPHLPPLRLQVCFLCLHLCSSPANRFISTIFVDSIYVIFVFPFLTYLILYDSKFIHITTNDPILFPHHLRICCFVVQLLSQPHGLQHARLSCPSLSPGVCTNPCPLSP